MRIKELIVESDNTSDLVSAEFDKFLQSRGYQMIARASKLFYKSPKSRKILVVANPIADKEFLDWVNFCNQNAGDQHLPKYTKLKVLTFQNPTTGKVEKYTTVFTEELYENRRGLAIEAIEQWGLYISGSPNILFSRALEAFLRDKEEDSGIDIEQTLNELYKQLGGYQEAAALFNSVKKTVLAGKKLGYDNDLLDDNIMINNKGLLVLNDPWARFD